MNPMKAAARAWSKVLMLDAKRRLVLIRRDDRSIC
jgi:hypothetical protein